MGSSIAILSFSRTALDICCQVSSVPCAQPDAKSGRSCAGFWCNLWGLVAGSECWSPLKPERIWTAARLRGQPCSTVNVWCILMHYMRQFYRSSSLPQCSILTQKCETLFCDTLSPDGKAVQTLLTTLSCCGSSPIKIIKHITLEMAGVCPDNFWGLSPLSCLCGCGCCWQVGQMRVLFWASNHLGIQIEKFKTFGVREVLISDIW